MRDDVPRCPHCAKPLQPLRYGVPFGPIATRIIDVVTDAGSDGIHVVDLFGVVYRDRSGATIAALKTYISTINERLAPAGIAIRIDRASGRAIAMRRRAA